jgi:putative ATP-binding cassette transporter
VPNVDGRIAEDARISTEEAVELAASLANTLITLACFVGVLWTLSAHPPILLGGTSVAVPGYLLWIAIAYSLAGMTISMLAGRPLVRATDRRLAMEADYRAALVRTRDEGRVEPGQNPVLGGLFRHLAGAFGRQSGAFALLETCVCFITRFGLGLPYLVATPAYLAGVVSLGWVMQAAQAFQMVSTALAWPIQNMPRIAVWRASAERVILLADSLAPASMPAPAGRPVPGALAPAARPPQMVG